MIVDDLLIGGTLVARPVLGAVLLYAGIAKLNKRDTFRELVEQYRLLPSRIALVLSFTLPLVEIALGAMLILGFTTRWAAFSAMLLLISFIVAVGIALFRDQHLTCLCFGNSRDVIGWWTIHRNIGLFLLALIIFNAREIPLSVDEFTLTDTRNPAATLQYMPIILIGISLVSLWYAAGLLMKIWR